MFLVDTNILVYAVAPDLPEHSRARRLVEIWRADADPWFSAWSVFYEFLRVVTHPRVLPQPLRFSQAVGFLQAVAESPGFSLLTETAGHLFLLRQLAEELPDAAGNRMHDLHLVALMREHGVTDIRTCDAGFRRFPFLRVLGLEAPGR